MTPDEASRPADPLLLRASGETAGTPPNPPPSLPREVQAQKFLPDQAERILESITDAFFALDGEWRFTYLNGQAQKVLQRQPGELIGYSIWEIYPGLAGSQFEEAYHRTVREQAATSFTSYYPDHDRWYEVHAYPASEGITVYFRDVTGRKKIEAERAQLMEDSERQRRVYETVLANMVDSIYVFDLDGRFTYANQALLSVWQRPLSDALGRTLADLDYPPDLAAKFCAQIQQVIATKQTLRDEATFTNKRGLRSYEYIFNPILGPDGAVEGVAGSTRDTTGRKQIEIELRASEERYREADRKKDEFLALLAHELRNPLAPIQTGLEIMHRSANNEAVMTKTRGIMERQLSHMVRLIDDLLDISRISANKMELRVTRTDLAEILQSAVETARPAIDAAGHQFFVTVPEEPVALDADVTRLAQVVSNLLLNSAKYTPYGGRIRLAAAVTGEGLAITVQDTGIGIPAGSQESIFSMFSQVDRSIERSTGGLGIGLALVKGLVELHGGTVRVASPGQDAGSTFTVILPLPERVDSGAEERPAAAKEGAGQRRRILVVDDNRDAALSLATLLEMLGNEMATAHDGEAAIERAREFRPDVIFMDVGMPGLSGYDATRRIRREEWGKRIRIVALTGWGKDSDREDSREAGCDAHLVKPVRLAEVQAVLEG